MRMFGVGGRRRGQFLPLSNASTESPHFLSFRVIIVLVESVFVVCEVVFVRAGRQLVGSARGRGVGQVSAGSISTFFDEVPVKKKG